MRDLADPLLRPEDFDIPEELQTDPLDPCPLLKRVVMVLGLGICVGALVVGVLVR